MKDLIAVSGVLMCSVSKSAKRHRASQCRSRLYVMIFWVHPSSGNEKDRNLLYLRQQNCRGYGREPATKPVVYPAIKKWSTSACSCPNSRLSERAFSYHDRPSDPGHTFVFW
jgi:hypothetical protein